MSKHNNNLAPSSALRCRCGRYGTIGEWQTGYRSFYECPDCIHRKYSTRITSEEYYKQFKR